MIIIFFFFQFQSPVDSLKAIFSQKQDIDLLIQINNLYRLADKFDSANIFLKECERYIEKDRFPLLSFLIAENLFFAGEILNAREKYLGVVARFSNNEVANNALERLYLIEMARKDTVALKGLARAICLIETDQLDSAEKSLKDLINGAIHEYALYYLALCYYKKDELNLALAILKDLDKDFKNHKIYPSKFLLAETYIKLKLYKEARKVLEDLIVAEPNSAWAVRARQMLLGI